MEWIEMDGRKETLPKYTLLQRSTNVCGGDRQVYAEAIKLSIQQCLCLNTLRYADNDQPTYVAAINKCHQLVFDHAREAEVPRVMLASEGAVDDDRPLAPNIRR